ncbi:6-bladed beta-propeller [Fodinibius halophilus]|uniref:6-bladed beta-propeller n=1 Tax=Fodinibius halophilus TaxID=1736908 RepID=A0A6M1T2D2_9BACT|nr:6-bladed beta-propeller [Fodinibius halophilus]NGP87385.1 6-bladed beta-propeller [Fodinibius halophilus]
MLNKLEFLLLIVVLVAGCNNSNENSLEVKYADGVYAHRIDPERSINITSEHLKNIKFIPLEATQSSLVGNILKLEKDSTTGYWYILSVENPYKIFVFDNDGNFVNDIQHHGNGPGEYTGVSDFYLSDGEWIEIFDNKKHHLVRYDLTADTLLAEKKLPFHAYKYTYLDNGNYVFYKNVQAKNFEDEKYFHKILVLDSTMSIRQKAFPFKLKDGGVNVSVSNPSGLFKTERGVIFNDFNADSIYLISSENIRPLHTLDFGKYTVPEPKGIDFSSSQELAHYYTKNKKSITGAKQLINTPEFFSFLFIYNDDLYFYMHKKHQKKAYIIDNIKFGRKEAFFPPPVERIDSMFVSTYTPVMLNQKISINNFKQDSDIYNAILEGKENQNPILVLYQFNLQQ